MTSLPSATEDVGLLGAVNDDERGPAPSPLDGAAFAFPDGDPKMGEATPEPDDLKQEAPVTQKPPPRWRRVVVAGAQNVGLMVLGAGVVTLGLGWFAVGAKGARGGVAVDGSGKAVDHGVALLAVGAQGFIDAVRLRGRV